MFYICKPSWEYCTENIDLAGFLIFPSVPLQKSSSLHSGQPHPLRLSDICAAASSIGNLKKSKTGKFSFTINILSSFQSYSHCDCEEPQLLGKKAIELGLF